LVPFFALAGAIAAVLWPRRTKALAHVPVIAGIGLGFLFSLFLLFVARSDATTEVMQWLSVSDLEIPIAFRVDGLTTMMLAMVTLVSGLVAVFAAGYMAGDPGYPRFFALIGLFVFSMTGLVLSNNYLLTYVFWEGVGTCSYLLIGFWHSRPSAAAAAIKAFLVNRIGDVGFAIAIFWMWSASPGHDLSYTALLSERTLAEIPQATIIGISVLLVWAATAKSAQIPLYVWLPDAMEGPTPVSALIHAATMVTAGVYLIARSMPLIAHAPGIQLLIAIIGCATALISAAIAVTQTDLKRVLAYSTISQLGYMFMALGAGIGSAAQLAVVAAMFHLFTHAFFKALLFLAAGSVMHAMGDVIDMRRFRGLRHRLPTTCWTFAVGGLALSGLFPLSGFFSKDEILLAIGTAIHEGQVYHWGWIYELIYWIAVLTAGLTAFYTGRAFFMTFWGPEKLPSPDDPEAPPVDSALAHAAAPGGEEGGHGAHGHGGSIGHESPPVMTYPLVALAACTGLIGLVCLLAGPFAGTTGWFEHQLAATLSFESLRHAHHAFDWETAVISTVFALIGLGASYLMYGEPGPVPADLAKRFRPLYDAAVHKFRVDEVYSAIFVQTTRRLAIVCEFLDDYVVNRLVLRIAELPGALARNILAHYQNGLVQFYAAVSGLTVAVLLLILTLL
jgi:NADH-quinone oxidoreductase subunit L